MMTSKCILVLSLLLPLAACDEDGDPTPTPPPPAAAEPAAILKAIGQSMADNGISKACANISLSISNPADTQAVFVRAPVLATPADEPPLVGQIVLVELNEDPDALKVQLGSKLTIDQCDDVIETGNTAVVDEEFLPISGTVRVEVTEIIEAGGPYPLYKANVSLQAVRFAADEAGVTLDLGTYSFGFLPG